MVDVKDFVFVSERVRDFGLRPINLPSPNLPPKLWGKIWWFHEFTRVIYLRTCPRFCLFSKLSKFCRLGEGSRTQDFHRFPFLSKFLSLVPSKYEKYNAENVQWEGNGWVHSWKCQKIILCSLLRTAARHNGKTRQICVAGGLLTDGSSMLREAWFVTIPVPQYIIVWYYLKLM